ncbi:hypothetical protein [Synechococcus sp. M16CYN]
MIGCTKHSRPCEELAAGTTLKLTTRLKGLIFYSRINGIGEGITLITMID